MDVVDYMQRALALAEAGRGRTKTNPLVGAVIVKDSEIIGEGCHHYYGGDHAEVDAIKHAHQSVEGATMFVTLEPCCHQGKTPPCTKALINSSIRKVYAAIVDPDPQVAGKGIKALREAGIEVDVGLCEPEAKKLNEAYIKYKTTGKPFVTLKIAQTLDGRIADNERNSKWITSEQSRQKVHKLRADHDAVLIGAGTASIDNPSLTTHDQQGDNPLRLILSRQGKLDDHLELFQNQDSAKSIVITSDGSALIGGCEVWHLPADSEGAVDLNELLVEAGKNLITSLLVEGGSEVFSRFIEQQLADKYIFVIAPKLLGNGLPAFVEKSQRLIDQAINFRVEKCEQTGDDIWMEAYPE